MVTNLLSTPTRATYTPAGMSGPLIVVVLNLFQDLRSAVAIQIPDQVRDDKVWFSASPLKKDAFRHPFRTSSPHMKWGNSGLYRVFSRIPFT